VRWLWDSLERRSPQGDASCAAPDPYTLGPKEMGMPRKDKVLVANGQGFWGDSLLGPIRLVREGPLDYLTLDYLAEVTMSVLQKQFLRDAKVGFATDFVKMIERTAADLVAKKIKVVANAGGVNPLACKDATIAALQELGLRPAGTRAHAGRSRLLSAVSVGNHEQE